MSTKLVRQQLSSVLRRTIDKHQEQQRSGEGKRSKKQGRRGKRKQEEGTAAEKQQQVLASNLKYFAKTTTAGGKAQDLVAELLAKQGFKPRPRKQQAEQQQQQHPQEDEDNYDDLAEFADLM